MSAQANLAALFKPTESEIWKEDLLWQPVPVHTVPKKLDILLHGGKSCPKYKIRYEYITEQSPEARETLDQYKDHIELWSKEMKSNVSTIKDVVRLYKTLLSDKLNKKP